MALPAKINKRNSSGEGWGMGFFLVFFPQDHHHDFNSSSPFKSPTLLKRTNSSHILTRAQSTIYICALLIFLTLLLFTLSTFEPHNSFLAAHPNLHHYRRHLSQNHPAKPVKSPALQGLGTLYTRGTRAMNDLVLCHVAESTTVGEVKLFLRAFHRSGLAAKSDLVFVFPSISTPDSFDEVIREENGLFLRVIRRYDSELSNGSNVSDFPASFDVAQLLKSGKRAAAEKGEPIWGRKIKSGFNASSGGGGGGGVDLSVLTRPSYGSVVGFGVGELDPENSLSGFLEHVPMSLRRWASYPMILGRLRRNFKHVMLVDVKEVLLLGDPLGRVRNRSPETVFLSPTPPSNHRKSSDKTHQKTFNPTVIMGGARGVRRLSAAMLTEIVRATTHPPHNKKKGPVTESAMLTRVAANEFLQKSIRLVTSGESIPEPSSLGGVTIANHTVVRRGNNSLDMEAVIMKHICSFSIDSSLYTDCQEPKA